MVPTVVSACSLAISIDACSNIIAQSLRAWRRDEAFVFDTVLFVRFVLFACIIEPLNYYWLAWLEKLFPSWKMARRRPQKPLAASLGTSGEAVELQEQNGKPREEVGEDVEEHVEHGGQEQEVRTRDWKNICLRWFVDCATAGAAWNCMAFLVIMGIFKGKTPGEIVAGVRNEFFVILLNSWKVWPIGGFFNMAFVPVEHRIIFYSGMGLIWNIYLSLVAARL